MNEDFAPSRLFTKLVRFWWALALLVVLGGGIGILISRVHPPVYESRAVITSVIDYSMLGKLDDYEEDQVFVGIGELIGSTAVKNAVIARAEKENTNLTNEAILNSLFLDRQDNRWVLRVRLNDANYAQRVNQIWAENAMAALTAMHNKAVADFGSQQYINSLVSCLQESVVQESGSAACNIQNISAIQKEIQNAINDPAVRAETGSLLLLHTSFELTAEPDLPGSPILLAQNLSALTGMLIALLLGLVLLSIDFPIRNKSESTR